MGSSAKKKASKKADFQKPKLKVGKARPKPSNLTNTSFKSKAITLAGQSLTVSAPTTTEQFDHHLSLLSSHSDTQRRDSLAHLSHTISSLATTAPLPQPLSILIPKLSPLLLDRSSSVREQVVKLLRQLPVRSGADIEEHVEKLSLYIRAGLTHIAVQICSTAIEALTWLLDVAGPEVVSCAGGWIKTCKTLCVMLSWPVVAVASPAAEEEYSITSSPAGGWNTTGQWKSSVTSTSTPVTSLLTVMTKFIAIGLSEPSPDPTDEGTAAARFPFPLMQSITSKHMMPKRSNAYGYLNLFGPPRDADGEAYEDVWDRQRAFRNLGYEEAIVKGTESLRKEGGEVGRVAGKLNKIVLTAMEGFEDY